jgi:hypothetical protein
MMRERRQWIRTKARRDGRQYSQTTATTKWLYGKKDRLHQTCVLGSAGYVAVAGDLKEGRGGREGGRARQGQGYATLHQADVHFRRKRLRCKTATPLVKSKPDLYRLQRVKAIIVKGWVAG